MTFKFDVKGIQEKRALFEGIVYGYCSAMKQKGIIDKFRHVNVNDFTEWEIMFVNSKYEKPTIDYLVEIMNDFASEISVQVSFKL